MRTVFATAHELCLDEEDQVIHEDGAMFDADTYSRMKYGDRAATQSFAHELASVIATTAPDVVFGDTPPEFLVAYKAVPPACYFMSRYCLDALNIQRVEAGQEPGRVTQIYKGAVTATNYASASEEDRRRELQSINFTLEGKDLTDKPVAVLDDIRITGGAERRILEVVTPASPAVTLLGYAAVFNAAQAARRPGVENELNSTAIRTIDDLLPSIEEDSFDLNIRTLKLLLAAPKHSLRAFMQDAPISLVGDIMRGTVDTGPDFIGKYRSGYKILRHTVQERGL